MATIQEASPAPWRLRLVPASFGNARFHVEQQARSSGRRVVVHEYPKRDDPYSESMGKHAVRYQITGYVIGPQYHLEKQALISVLENSDGAALIDPYIGRPLNCICERYSVTEVRQRGGYCAFEMAFVEVGTAGNTLTAPDSASALKTSAADTSSAAAALLDAGNTP